MIDLTALVSRAAPSVPIHSVTYFASAFSTLPSHEESGLSAGTIIDHIAPADGPRITEHKETMPYFVPCLLRVAPYVGKTAARFPGRVGKQRSAVHVTTGSWLAFDLDGTTRTQKETVLGRLESLSVRFCAYSTFSNGKTPGESRMRVLLFLDRALEPGAWADAWHVVNVLLLGGLADPQTARLSQQAGVWATSQERAALAFRHVGGGALLSADVLLALAPPKAEHPKYTAPLVPRSENAQRYVEALAMIGAETYQSWHRGFTGLKGAVMTGELDEDDAIALFVAWSEAASPKAKAQNAIGRYDPAEMWTNWRPTLVPGAALVGSLFAAAKNVALDTYHHERGATLSGRAIQAARYLARYHRATFRELMAAAEAEA